MPVWSLHVSLLWQERCSEKPVPASVLNDVDVAVVIPANYDGPGVTTATPGTNTQGAGAPGGPTC